MLPSQDLIAEHAYLVARGVRALAVVGRCEADAAQMLSTATELERHAQAGAVPFVFDRGDGVADYGYAAAAWVLDLYRWLHSDGVPATYRHHVTGLLLGYSAAAIREHDEAGAGRLFDEATVVARPWRTRAAS